MKQSIKIITFGLMVVMLISIAACNRNSTSSDVSGSGDVKKVTLTFFSNVPDRNAGLGLLEEKNLDVFLDAHPHVELKTEFLGEEPYKQKLKAYMASNQMPDVWQQWGIVSELTPVVKGGHAAELNMADYSDYGFVPGALDAFTINGKLYGLPKNSDFWVVYYNQKIFEDNDIKVPETTDDLIKAAKVLKVKDIIPMTLPGQEKWATCAALHNLMFRETGDASAISNAIFNANTSDSPNLLAGINEFLRLIDNDVFPSDFNTADYGSARNLFAQGKAAMFMMGSWEMGLGSDASIADEVRDNIRAMYFPIVNGTPGKNTDLVMWFGGGYSVSANSQSKEEAINLINYVMQPKVYAKNGWELQVVIAPMDFTEFMTGNESPLQKDLINIMNSAKAASGDLFNGLLNPTFKSESEELTQKVAGKMITPQEYLRSLDKSAGENK